MKINVVSAFLTLTLCLILSTPAYTQWWYSSVSYQMSVPTGYTKDFAGKTSWRGIGVDFRKSFNPNTTYGIMAGWNVFYERFTGSQQIAVEENPGVITGLQDRWINSFPIMLNVHMYLGKQGGIRPFGGLNAGGFLMKQRFDIGLLQLDKSQWQWGGAPEIGVVIPVGYSTKLLLNGKYFFALTGDSVLGGSTKYSYLTFGVGVVWEQ